jgi:hypothetical protein
VEIADQVDSIVPVDPLQLYADGDVIDRIALTCDRKQMSFHKSVSHKRVPVDHSRWFT